MSKITRSFYEKNKIDILNICQPSVLYSANIKKIIDPKSGKFVPEIQKYNINSNEEGEK